MMPESRTVAAPRLAKVMALLDSDQVGEALAAARALRRILDPGADAPAPTAPADASAELEACLTYAVEAVGQLSREIAALRRDNARLRAHRWFHPTAAPARERVRAG
ncbi:MAG TPA: hypothetical protein VMB81_11265 [Candidatus Sulfotelmatobacter sp.]|nr:hypothetical protein [Candidatus Sulfotelmatobacter sp.]